MSWNFRGPLRIFLRKTGQAIVLVVYAIVAVTLSGVVESYIVNDHFPFNVLKFTIGVFLALSALPVVYLLNGREIDGDRVSSVWYKMAGGILSLSVLVGVLSLTYWSQYMHIEYYKWTTLGIYAAAASAISYQYYRN